MRAGRWLTAAVVAGGAWVALGGTASADVDSPVVPATAGMMGAVEAPPSTEPVPVLPTILRVGGGVLLAGGALTAAKSWVSPVPAG